jgi:hypothetical protein
MTFDPRAAEAQLALNRIGTTDLPRLAWDALEAGYDGPAIRRLAALEFPTFFEVQQILPSAMREMSLVKIDTAEAACRFAKIRARGILDSNRNPLEGLGDFYVLWRQANYCGELAGIGYLGEEADIALSQGSDENEIRAWVMERIREFAAC